MERLIAMVRATLIVLVVLKTGLDLFFHLREHARSPAGAPATTA